MFDELQQLPADPILGLMQACRRDPNERKIDLSVGIYMDDAGQAPVMSAVYEAERRLLECENTKAYVGTLGDPAYNALVTQLLLGEQSSVAGDGRTVTVQTPGGCGALRIAAELIRQGNPAARVWVSDPSWPNHRPLLTTAGLECRSYPYYDRERSRLDFDAMMTELTASESGDVLLLHGCCHNPTGADLDEDQWRAVRDLVLDRGLVPLVDFAYQGLADGIEEDTFGVRLLAESVPEMLVAASCSKNFALYRERTGSLVVLSGSAATTDIISSTASTQIRRIYSMPPSHGAAVVALVLSDAALRAIWLDELDGMRSRLTGIRRTVAERLAEVAGDRFDFISTQHGLFSYLGISAEEIEQLRAKFSIYLVGDTRFNIAALNERNLDYFIDSLNRVIQPA